jgi:hypothetical protein
MVWDSPLRHQLPLVPGAASSAVARRSECSAHATALPNFTSYDEKFGRPLVTREPIPRLPARRFRAKKQRRKGQLAQR